MMAILTFMTKLTVWFLLLASVVCFNPARPVAFRSVALAAEKKADLMGSFKSFLGGDKDKDSTVSVLEKPSINKEATNGDEPEEKLSESDYSFKKIKEAGRAGAISLFLWEAAFWVISFPVVTFGYVQATGHMPDFSDKEDLSKLGAEAFAFANLARFALPIRIGLAVSTIPFVQENVVDRFWPDEIKEE
jgi:hypothetical protein